MAGNYKARSAMGVRAAKTTLPRHLLMTWLDDWQLGDHFAWKSLGVSRPASQSEGLPGWIRWDWTNGQILKKIWYRGSDSKHAC